MAKQSSLRSGAAALFIVFVAVTSLSGATCRSRDGSSTGSAGELETLTVNVGISGATVYIPADQGNGSQALIVDADKEIHDVIETFCEDELATVTCEAPEEETLGAVCSCSDGSATFIAAGIPLISEQQVVAMCVLPAGEVEPQCAGVFLDCSGESCELLFPVPFDVDEHIDQYAGIACDRLIQCEIEHEIDLSEEIAACQEVIDSTVPTGEEPEALTLDELDQIRQQICDDCATALNQICCPEVAPEDEFSTDPDCALIRECAEACAEEPA